MVHLASQQSAKETVPKQNNHSQISMNKNNNDMDGGVR